MEFFYHQVIKTCPFYPLVGGHRSNLWVRVTFSLTIPKKGHENAELPGKLPPADLAFFFSENGTKTREKATPLRENLGFPTEGFFCLGSSWDRSWKGLKEWKVWFGGDCEGLECTEGAFCLDRCPFVDRWVLVWHSDGSNVWLVVFVLVFGRG